MWLVEGAAPRRRRRAARAAARPSKCWNTEAVAPSAA